MLFKDKEKVPVDFVVYLTGELSIVNDYESACQHWEADIAANTTLSGRLFI